MFTSWLRPLITQAGYFHDEEVVDQFVESEYYFTTNGEAGMLKTLS